MPKRYCVSLNSDERRTLEKLTNSGKASPYQTNHARILLKADKNQAEGGWIATAISQALNISIPAIERVRRRFVEESLEAALGQSSTQSHNARHLKRSTHHSSGTQNGVKSRHRTAQNRLKLSRAFGIVIGKRHRQQPPILAKQASRITQAQRHLNETVSCWGEKQCFRDWLIPYGAFGLTRLTGFLVGLWLVNLPTSPQL